MIARRPGLPPRNCSVDQGRSLLAGDFPSTGAAHRLPAGSYNGMIPPQNAPTITASVTIDVTTLSTIVPAAIGSSPFSSTAIV